MPPCDYSKYPTNWKETRDRILERAGNRCEICLVANHQYVFRGTCNGVEAYQYNDMSIFSASNGSYIGNLDIDGSDLKFPENTKAVKIVLTIAHLDHDAENHDVTDDRLKAMCQRCHLGYDMPNHIANRKASIKKKKGLIEFDFDNKPQQQ